MIKGFIFENFKSFEKAELSLEAVTSLIGANSSGKSNAIEGIQILSETASGLELGVILDGTRNRDSGIRGGSASCCRFRTSAFKLGCYVALDDRFDLCYFIKISTDKRIWVEEEGLYKIGKNALGKEEKVKLFKTEKTDRDNEEIYVKYQGAGTGNVQDILCVRKVSVLAQLSSKLPRNTEYDRECLRCINAVLDNLKNIFVLTPMPSVMRDYERLTDTVLKSDCENISPVLYHLCQDNEKKKELLKMISSLPENEVLSIEFIKTQLDDVIFGLKEKYMSTSEIVDAKKLSDGTLRCIAIFAAILSMKENGMLVVEEIDNGIHPGRTRVLIENLEKIGRKKKIDIVLTTHNPVLLNGYDRKKLLGVSVVYREQKKGSSKFIPLADIERAPALFASGGLGDAMADDSLINMIKETWSVPDLSWLGV